MVRSGGLRDGPREFHFLFLSAGLTEDSIKFPVRVLATSTEVTGECCGAVLNAFRINIPNLFSIKVTSCI